MDRSDFLKTLSVGAGVLLGGAPPIEAGERPRQRDLELQDAQAPYKYIELAQGEVAPVYQRKIYFNKLPNNATRHVKHYIKGLRQVINVSGVELQGDSFSALSGLTLDATSRNLIVRTTEDASDKEALIFVHYIKRRSK